MIINCPNCNTKYSINKRVLGRSGKRVKCFSCNKEWFQKLEITDKKIKIKPLVHKKILTDLPEVNIETEKLLYQEEPKRKNYRFLYLLIFVIFILFVFLISNHFKYKILNYFPNFNIKNFFVTKEIKKSGDLIFNQIEKEISSLNNNEKVIKISGKIINTSSVDGHKVPQLKATLLGSENNVLNTWLFNTEKKHLDPEESLIFTTSYIHDEKDVSDIKIEFYNEEDE
tara:strand:- start:36 stop:716 length:681 start_codon:yes stop_codon:yes gene_type:complete